MSDLIGQTIGNYRIEALIGSGGMAQVYRAVHVNLNRPAAIKVMHANLAADARFQERFKQEAKAAAQLSHPNIIAIHDFTEQEQGGLLYLVMEYIEAGSVRTLLQQSGGATPLPLALGVDLVQQAANGLAFAHSRGMIHRDIKPDNLLLGEAGAHAGAGHAYTVKIADFGLARLVEGGVATRSGVTMGSPAYMSPEQCEGAELDGRSDLYSLGIVLYEVTTGYLPFEIKTVTDAVYKHMSVAPLSPRTVRPDLPIALNEIILRCLAKRPGDRFATATELSTALQEVMDELGLSAPARAPSPVRQTVQVPHTTAPIPPPAPHVGRGSSLPRLFVLDQNGQQQNMLAISTRGVTLGRSADNVVVLADPLVSRAHLRVDWDGKQVTVTDLGAANGTYLGDLRLTPQMPKVWTGDEWLRAGPFWLYIQPSNGQAVSQTRSLPAPPPVPPVTPALAAPVFVPPEPPPAAYTPSPASPAPVGDSGRIRVVVEEGKTLQITPGETALVRVKVANFGATVDHFRVSVEGMPAAWVQGQEKEVQLIPRADTVVTLTIATQRSPEYVAGEYPVRLRAWSRENRLESGSAEADWTILPYTASSLVIDPTVVTGRRKAEYTATIRNGGNATGRYALAGKDDENKIAYRFTPETIDIDPGAAAPVGVSVRAPRRWFGRAQARPFIVEATPTVGQPPPPVRAEWVQPRVLAWWMLAPLAIVLLPIAFIFLFLPPKVTLYTIPASPVAGQPMMVIWKAQNASTIDLSQDGRDIGAKGLDANLGGRNFEKAFTGKVEAVAHSRWLPLFTRSNSATVTSVQPTPTPIPGPIVDSVTLDKHVALPGATVTVQWAAHNADSVTIMLSTGLTDPNKPITGSQPYMIDGNTVFTVIAINKGGQQAKSDAVFTTELEATTLAGTTTAKNDAASTVSAGTVAAQSRSSTAASQVQTVTAGSTATAQTALDKASKDEQTASAKQNITAQASVMSGQSTAQAAAINGQSTVQASVASGQNTAQASIASGNSTALASISNANIAAQSQTAKDQAATQTANSTAAAGAASGTRAAQTQTAKDQAATQTTTSATGTATAKITITVTQSDGGIKQDVKTIKAGMVILAITNTSATLQHTYQLNLGSQVIHLETVDPGDTRTVSVNLTTPGTYTVTNGTPSLPAATPSAAMTTTLLVVP